ncbi:hypothetical protein PQX77_010537 [Marasmius sp. AFHP31]|nr:hypothetical protein PQX77_010537 [Marasmius sp. AFHP31]
MAGSEYTSRFSNLLSTNYTALSEEIEEIKVLLAEPKRELVDLDEEIDSLKSKLKGLSTRRATVGKFVDSHLALVSPFRRLPDDALVEIFLRCIPTNRNPTRSMAESPLLLTRINRKCREVTLNTPSLWSALHIYVPQFDESNQGESKSRLKRRAEGVQAWLERSGSLPLNLSVVVGPYKESRQSNYTPIIRVLASVSNRWRNFELTAPNSFMKTLDEDAGKGPLSYLKSIKVDYTKQASQPSDNLDGFGPWPVAPPQPTTQLVFTNVLSNIPEIRSLALYNYTSNVLAISIAWENLTQLELHSRGTRHTADELLVVLRRAASSLQYCDITVYCPSATVGSEAEETSAHTYISFPKLHTFKVHLSVQFDAWLFNGQGARPPMSLGKVDAFFATIVAPSLSTFLFATSSIPCSGFFDRLPFLPMISKTECRLENLHLSFPVKSPGLIECLRLTPDLKLLNYSECLWAVVFPTMTVQGGPQFPSPQESRQMRKNACVVTDSFFDLLSLSPETVDPICPHLQSIVLTGVIPATEKAILRFAQSRAPSHIRCVEASTDEPGLSTRPSSSPIKRIYVSYDRDTKSLSTSKRGVPHDNPTLAGIQKLKSEEGMDIRLSYHTPYAPMDSPWAGQPNAPGLYGIHSHDIPLPGPPIIDDGPGGVAGDDFDEDGLDEVGGDDITVTFGNQGNNGPVYGGIIQGFGNLPLNGGGLGFPLDMLMG